jgi:hypothetical protein
MTVTGLTVFSRRAEVLRLLSDGRWHSTYAINAVGGTEGTRRLRELREQGYEIEKRSMPESMQFEYRLVNSPGSLV